MTKGRNKWWFSVTLFILLHGKRSQAAVPVITYKVPDGVTGKWYLMCIPSHLSLNIYGAYTLFSIVFDEIFLLTLSLLSGPDVFLYKQ